MKRKSIKRTWNDLTIPEREDMIKNQSIVYRVAMQMGKLTYKAYNITRNNFVHSGVLELKDIDTDAIEIHSLYNRTPDKYQSFGVNDIFLSKESAIMYLIERCDIHDTDMIDDKTMKEMKLFMKNNPYYLI